MTGGNSPPPPPPPPIVATSNVTVNKSGNEISVNTQDIDPTGAGLIKFELKGRPGYKFLTATQDAKFGINIKPATPVTDPPAESPDDEFTNYVRVSDTEVTVQDMDNNNANYPFDVTVEDGNNNRYTSDPSIRNRGGG